MSHKFQLPDGSLVATGNNKPAELPRLYAPMADKITYFDKSDIEDLLKPDSPVHHLNRKAKYGKWMINQSSIGKCNTSAAAGSMYVIRDRQGHKHVPLADNHMYIHINGGQDRGSLLREGMERGIAGMAPRQLTTDDGDVIGDFPHLAYSQRQVNRKVWDAAEEQASRFKMHEPLRLPESYDEFKIAVATALAMGLPIVMAWHVSNDSMRLRNGRVQVGRGPGNHASLLESAVWVGGDDIVHGYLKNSWGPVSDPVYGPQSPGWGDDGYGIITMEDLFACRRHHDYYVITGSNEDPWNDPMKEET